MTEKPTSASTPPFHFARGRVEEVTRLSPSFARVTFSGEALGQFGNPRQTLDQRIKLVFPGETGLPALAPTDGFADWKALAEADRGSMRTFSIRDLLVDEDGNTRVVVDFALHPDQEDAGPAARWISRAQPGDELLLFGPRRGRTDGGGIEYHPGAAERVFLVGDETAVPAISRTLEETRDCGQEVTALLEVPTSDDKLEVATGARQQIEWYARNGGENGELVIPSLLEKVGISRVECDAACNPSTDDGAAPWETATYSNLDELAPSSAELLRSCYFWIAGESKMVTALRRHLVKELGAGREAVAFMGYWRKGVAMRA